MWISSSTEEGTEFLAEGIITSPVSISRHLNESTPACQCPRVWVVGSFVARQVSLTSDSASQAPFLDEKKDFWPFALRQPGGLLLWLTIPNVRLQPDRYISSFFMSMLWLSVTAYVVCIGSDRINVLWGIPRSFLGLTLVAIGTSWPNLLASIVTARPFALQFPNLFCLGCFDGSI